MAARVKELAKNSNDESGDACAEEGNGWDDALHSFPSLCLTASLGHDHHTLIHSPRVCHRQKNTLIRSHPVSLLLPIV